MAEHLAHPWLVTIRSKKPDKHENVIFINREAPGRVPAYLNYKSVETFFSSHERHSGSTLKGENNQETVFACRSLKSQQELPPPSTQNKLIHNESSVLHWKYSMVLYFQTPESAFAVCSFS